MRTRKHPQIAGVRAWCFHLQRGASTTTFSFTPRGAVSATNIQVRFSIDGLEPVRCVQLTGLLGLPRLGSNNASGNVSTACAASEFNRA